VTTTEAPTPEQAAGKPALHFAPTAGMLLVKLGRFAEARFKEALKPTELTPKHLGVLFEVRANPTSQQLLCQTIDVDASKLVAILNDLEEDGLIVRRRDPNDRRRHIVELTKEAQSRLAKAEKVAKSVEEEFFAGLDADERAQLRLLLARVADKTGVIRGCPSLIVDD
jgi:DNA-binding MarR family transcriptional regulator